MYSDQYNIWAPKPILVAGGLTPESAATLSQEHANAVAVFGRLFISNLSAFTLLPLSRLTAAAQPDLPRRIQNGITLTTPDRTTYYVPGPDNVKGKFPLDIRASILVTIHSPGYTDYTFATGQ